MPFIQCPEQTSSETESRVWLLEVVGESEKWLFMNRSFFLRDWDVLKLDNGIAT